jgi:hypothetical protein
VTKSSQTVTAPHHPPAVAGLSALVRAVGLARLDAAALAASRRAPGPIPEGWKPIAPTFLKTSDDQTVAAVCGVFDAIAAQPDTAAAAFADWGIVVASRYLGRAQLASALRRFAQEGVWGVSPHLIPHFALHSPAGTLSLALGSHGPNLGVGGGPTSAVEGALTALTWLSEGRLPGVWLMLTGHEPDLIPDSNVPTESRALALALTPDDGTASRSPRLRIVASDGVDDPGPLDLVDLHARLAAGLDDPRAIASASGLRLEWTTGDAARRTW